MIRLERRPETPEEPWKIVREPGKHYGSEAWCGPTPWRAFRLYWRRRREWRRNVAPLRGEAMTTYRMLDGREVRTMGKKRWLDRWSTWSIVECAGVIRSEWEVTRGPMLAWNKSVTRAAGTPTLPLGLSGRVEYRRTVSR